MVASAGFIHGRSEALGVNTGTSAGTLVTAGAVNTFGSWVSLGQTSFAWDWFNVNFVNVAASDKVMEIGASADGSNWYTIASGLRFAGRKYADITQSYGLPIRVRSGAYVGVRCMASTASHTLHCSMVGASVSMKGATGYSRAVALYTPATSRGVTVDPGASANTKGAWAQLTASTPASVDSILVMVGQNADTTRTAATDCLFDIGIGASSSEFAMIPDIGVRWTTTSDGPAFVYGPLPCYIPAGSRVVARAQATDVTAGDRTLDVAVIGFVP